MMKNLRMLCLGLAAATITAGFAQAENVTSKLKNADMEQGIKHWGIEGVSNIWGKNTKTHSSAYKTRIGYHGMNEGVLENWKGSIAEGLADNEITQTVKNLPNGTYVFGAYIGASKQDSVLNREEVVGVTLFANDATVPVATENPDKGLKNTHTAKFNVAVKVTDGTLNVGLRAQSTNANFLVWDNATLYYFGDKDEAAALDEMAKIDLAGVTAIADTIMPYKMQVDSLAYLNEAYAAAKEVTTAAAAWDASEELYWAIYKAHSSLGDYRSFNNAIKTAEKIAGMEWSAVVAKNVEALNELIAAAKVTYETATADRAELNEQKAELTEAAAYVELDSAYTKIDIYTDIADNMEAGEEVGEYSQEMIDRIGDILEEVGEVLDASDNGLAATVAKHRCDSLYALIEDVLANPISFDTFPITITTSQQANADNRYTYTSKVYSFTYPLTTLRFTFLDTFCPNGSGKGDPVFVALGEFYLYDGKGNLIELSAENFKTNAQEASEGALENICDGDISTYFHSDWHGNVKENHYIEVTIPDGIQLTSFSFGWIDRGNKQNIPLVVEVNLPPSEAADDLVSAVNSAKEMSPYQGTTPGFYNADLSGFYNALAAAEALVGTSAADPEIYAAITALEEEQGKVEELGVIMPEEGKEYRIISAGPFFAQQHVMKALSVYCDTAVNNRIYWETASVDSAQQVFTFEKMENAEGKDYYHVKHVATGKYISDYIGFDGDVADNNAHGLSETPDTVELIPLGYGQFALANGALDGNNSNWIHAGGHSAGAGIKGNTVKWNTEANNSSAWFIREMQVLPFNAKSLSDLNFETTAYSLYKGVNSLALTADKDCAFADFKLYGLYGEEIAVTPIVSGASAMIVLDSLIESFSFSFTNAEKVAVVAVNAEVTKLSELQEAYDAAVAVNPTYGTEVMQYKDLKAYNAALDAAEALLLNGGSNEEVEAAIAAIEAAVEGLVPNMPDPDKTYYIVSALGAFEENHGVKMMLYATAAGEPRWMYENPYKPNRMWKFEAGPEATDDKPAMYYVKNVELNAYLGSTPSALSEQASPYAITSLGSGQIALDMDNQGTNSGRIHANGHSSGAGKGSNIVFWGSGINTASAWYIFESEAYLADIDFTQFDEEANEYVAPAVKGIYDLFGRRIEVPATTGIYIVDGKKKVIKK